jgi:SAM-dependent methyltransferase
VNETSKTRRLWTEAERSLLTGRGIDIGCGPDPVSPDVRRFDVHDGDANDITRYVAETFDFVYSSHCLEHMRDVPAALAGWWTLVKPNGVLWVIVPDEDLYEQGVFPSRFNSDHKATFTISKAKSWSSCSFNLFDLVSSLPNAEILSITLHDADYDRRLMTHGDRPFRPLFRLLHRAGWFCERRFGFRPPLCDALIARLGPVDQTLASPSLAQIQVIARKQR